jgi:hypothetical protein
MRAVVAVVTFALSIGMVAAPVAAAVLHTTFPVAGTFTNPCTGEAIAFTGSMQVLIGQSDDGTGALEITMHSDFHGVTGVGVLTGKRYEIPMDSGQIMSVGRPPLTVTQSNDFRVISGTESFSGRFPLRVTLSLTNGLSASAGPLQLACQ